MIEKFARVEDDYTSIGTPCHELGHHILDLDHGPAPTDHDLMGVGAEEEDPVVGLLHRPSDHYATPTDGADSPQQGPGRLRQHPRPPRQTTRGLELHSPESKDYNVIQLPVVDGFVYLETRSATGYDRSIPFCSGHAGGLFTTEASQYLMPLNVPGIAAHLAAASFDEGAAAVLQLLQFAGAQRHVHHRPLHDQPDFGARDGDDGRHHAQRRHPRNREVHVPVLVNDPARAGYRMWRIVTAEANKTIDIDVATFPSGTDPNGYFTMNLEAYYNTGEVRLVNADATWTSNSNYVVLLQRPINEPRRHPGDAIVNIIFATLQPRTPTAVVNVSHGAFTTAFRLINIP